MNTPTPFKVNLAVFAETKGEQLSRIHAFRDGFRWTEYRPEKGRRFPPRRSFCGWKASSTDDTSPLW